MVGGDRDETEWQKLVVEGKGVDKPYFVHVVCALNSP